MKLRWFSVCNEHGMKSEPVLQFWNGNYWESVDYVECKSWDVDYYTSRKDPYN